MSDLVAILRLLFYAALIIGSMVILDWFESKRSRGGSVRRAAQHRDLDYDGVPSAAGKGPLA